MRKIHKFLSVVLAIMMVWSIVPVTAFAANAGSCGDNLTWVYNSSTYTLTISGTGNMRDFSYTNRPWEAQEDKIKTVVINDGVTSIGAYAFYSFGKVTSITIPDSVTKIGMTAFNACKLLTSIELPEGITSIPNRAFTNCTSLTSITIPASVKIIGSSAFEGCSGLTSVVIPEGVTTINDKAFASCKGLTSVTIPASVTSIDITAFENCTNLTSLTVDSNNPNYSIDEFGVLFNKEKTTLILYSKGSTATSYTIPDSVTTIGVSAFEGCSSLASISIPEGVTKIQDRAFASCIGLISVSIPTSVTMIGINAFVGTALYDNSENWINNILYINDCLIVANSSIAGIVQIKDGTRMIADEAFYGCTSIISVVFPEGVTIISKGAFANCLGLVNVTIPVSVKEIRDSAFSGCSSIQEVYYSGEGKDWFEILFGIENESLTAATLLSGPGGEEISIPGGFIGDIKWFYDEKSKVLTISGNGKMQDYGSSNRPWEAYVNDIQTVVIEDGVTSVGEYAFYNLDSLSSVVLPNGITTINSYAFGSCDALTEIILPKTLETIWNDAFVYDTSLVNINLDGVKIIGSAVFKGCTSLKSVTIGKNLESIGKRAFDECTMLDSFTVDSENPNFSSDEDGVLFNKDKTELVIYPAGNSRTSYKMPDTVTVIKTDSFDGCRNLATLVLSKNLRKVESSAFEYCSITEFNYPGSVETWEADVVVGEQNNRLNSDTLKYAPTDPEAITSRCGDNLIWTLNSITGDMVISGTGEMYNYSSDSKRPWEKYASSIVNVVIENGVTSIGAYAFANCNQIKNVTFGDSVTTIGVRAFVSCASLEALAFPDSVKTIGTSAFLDCEGVKNIIIGKGLETIEVNTFGCCASLENITVDSENPNFASDELGVLFNKDKTLLVKYPEGNSRTKYTIPDSVTIIEAYAFYTAKNLTEVIIPDGVTLIGTGAFAKCENLKTIDIPDSVTTMGEDVFNYCLKLEKAKLPDGISRIEAQTFYLCEGLTEVIIPASVNNIGQNAFGECISLETINFKGTSRQWTGMIIEGGNQPINIAVIHFNYGEGDFSYEIVSEVKKTIRITSYNIFEPSMRVVIPETIDGYTVVEIGAEAFYNFDSLVSVKIPASVTSIGEKAFYDCDGIMDITIPESVITIGKDAFASCDKLAIVLMGKSVRLIENGAFFVCNALATVCYTGTEEEWNSIVIGENNQPLLDATKNFEYGNLDAISGTCGENLTWSLDLYSGVLTISGTGEMYEYGSLDYPWINYKTSIGEVVISDGVTAIGDYAFKSCTSIEKVTIAGSVTVIGSSAFAYCSKLENVTINDGVKTIGNSAFAECKSLKSIVIPDSVTLIKNSAFENCESLTTVELSKNLKEINGSTFYYCPKLKEITIPEGVTRIGEKAFYSCAALTEVTVPESVTSIADYAFAYCRGLEAVRIGIGVKQIGYRAFYYCSQLKDVYYSGSQSQWTMISIHSNNSELLAATIHCLGPEHPHEFVTVVTEPTCYDQGYTTYSCECGYIYKDDYVEALGHDFVGVVTSPTCTKEGYTTYECSRCIERYVGAEPIPATGHTFVSEITTQPTHFTEGVEKLTCKDCGYTNTKPVEKIAEHSYETVITAPTCTEQGYTTFTCVCGDSYIGDYVPVIGHTIEQFESIITEPDCLNEGSKEVVSCCSVCNAGLGVEIVAIPAHGHTPAKAVEENYVAPTCTENGSKDTVVYCSVCDEEISRETVAIEAIGHTDNDGNGYCDMCNELLDILEECGCDCHKPGISGFFWNLKIFFSKIFGTNKMCECGVAHY